MQLTTTSQDPWISAPSALKAMALDSHFRSAIPGPRSLMMGENPANRTPARGQVGGLVEWRVGNAKQEQNSHAPALTGSGAPGD